MCFYGDIWCFLGEIDEESFHLGGHRWPRRRCQKKAIKNGRDRDDEGAMVSCHTERERSDQTWPRRKRRRRGEMKGAAEMGRLLLWGQKVNFLEVVALEVLVFEEAFVVVFVEAFVDFFEEDCVVAAGTALEA